MRQIILMMLVVGVGVFIGGCGEKKEGGTSEAVIAPAAPKPITPFLSNLNETIKLNFASGKDSMYYFNKAELDSAYKYFLSNFTYKNATDALDKTREKVNTAALQEIFNKIKTDTKYNEATSFCALRIHFGMLEKKIILIYEPVILNPNGTRGFCKIDAIRSNKYFNDNGKLTLANEDSVKVLIKNYQSSNSNIFIKHEIGAPKDFNKFYVDSTSKNEADRFNFSDARYALMTFKQIKEMYDNAQIGKSSKDSIITFSLVANNWFYKGNSNRNSTKNYKLHVVVHCNLDMQAKNAAATENLGADATQIPPPPESNVAVYLPIP